MKKKKKSAKTHTQHTHTQSSDHTHLGHSRSAVAVARVLHNVRSGKSLAACFIAIVDGDAIERDTAGASAHLGGALAFPHRERRGGDGNGGGRRLGAVVVLARDGVRLLRAGQTRPAVGARSRRVGRGGPPRGPRGLECVGAVTGGLAVLARRTPVSRRALNSKELKRSRR